VVLSLYLVRFYLDCHLSNTYCIGALCYAEIGTVIPRSGGEIAYMKEGIGSAHQQTGAVLAYLYNWASAFILRPSGLAVLALTFSQYILSGIMNGKLVSSVFGYVVVYPIYFRM
jgi:amino acid transporter